MRDIHDGSGLGQLDVSCCSMKVHKVHHEGKFSFILPQDGQQMIKARHDQFSAVMSGIGVVTAETAMTWPLTSPRQFVTCWMIIPASESLQ